MSFSGYQIIPFNTVEKGKLIINNEEHIILISHEDYPGFIYKIVPDFSEALKIIEEYTINKLIQYSNKLFNSVIWPYLA